MLRKNSERIAARLADKAYGPYSQDLNVWHTQYANDLLSRHTGEPLGDDFEYADVLTDIITDGLRFSLRGSQKLYNSQSLAKGALALGQQVFIKAGDERGELLDQAFGLSASRLQATALKGTSSHVRNLMQRAAVASSVVTPPSERLNYGQAKEGADRYFTEFYQAALENEFGSPNPDIKVGQLVCLLSDVVEMSVTPTLNREVRAFDLAIDDVRTQLLPTTS